MVLGLIGLLAVLAGPPAGQLPTPKPKLICHGGEIETGSHRHIGARCLTQEQWEQEDGRRDNIPATLRVTAAQGDGQPAAKQPQ
jgi:hypothetical protein